MYFQIIFIAYFGFIHSIPIWKGKKHSLFCTITLVYFPYASSPLTLYYIIFVCNLNSMEPNKNFGWMKYNLQQFELSISLAHTHMHTVSLRFQSKSSCIEEARMLMHLWVRKISMFNLSVLLFRFAYHSVWIVYFKDFYQSDVKQTKRA